MRHWTTDGSAASDTRYPSIVRKNAHWIPLWILNLIGRASRRS